MIRVEKCCCGVSLRTGTLVIMRVYMVLCTIAIVQIIQAMWSSGEGNFMNCVLLLWNFIGGIIAVYGIEGVNKKRPSFLLAFITYRIVEMFLWLIMLLSLLAGASWMKQYLYAHLGSSSRIDQNIYNTLSTFFAWSLGISIIATAYFTVVVYSYYKQLDDEVRITPQLVR